MRSALASTFLCLTAGVNAQDFALPDGFVIEKFADHKLADNVFTLAVGPRGQVTVAGPGYVRILKDVNGDGRADKFVTFSDRPKNGAQGLGWDGDSLFVVGDKGLYRYTDSDRDDNADGPGELLYELKTGREHTAHAVKRGPDGRLYVMCGNMTGIDGKFVSSEESPIQKPTAGCLIRFSPDFKRREIVAHGFRNAYDFDFDGTGRVFTYDSDNERCVGLPWYEHTRFYHVLPGGHHGWLSPQRAVTWRLPSYLPDVVPPVATLDRGSPTGVCWYGHTAFPAKYRRGFFAADWTFGRVWFVPPAGRLPDIDKPIKPELFIEALGVNGFAPTGMAVHPKTGDLYIAVGGRGTRGGVYRVRHTKTAANAGPVRRKNQPPPTVNEMESRVKTLSQVSEAFTLRDFEKLNQVRAVQLALGGLGSPATKGRAFHGYTARRPLPPAENVKALGKRLADVFPSGDERLDRELARTLAMLGGGPKCSLGRILEKITMDTDPAADVHYLLCASRYPAKWVRLADRFESALVLLEWKYQWQDIRRDRNWPRRIDELVDRLYKLNPKLPLAVVNCQAFSLPGHATLVRGAGREIAARKIFKYFITQPDIDLTRQAVRLLGELRGPEARQAYETLWARGQARGEVLKLIAARPTGADRPRLIEGLASADAGVVSACARGLGRLGRGKFLDAQLVALVAARDRHRGKTAQASVQAQLKLLTGQAFATRSEWKRWFKTNEPGAYLLLSQPNPAGTKAWQNRLTKIPWDAGDAVSGKAVFAKASCAQCHGQGGRLGPNLRGVAKRFSRADLFTAILHPDRDVSDRYRSVDIATADGRLIRGMVVYSAADGTILQTADGETARVSAEDILQMKPSKQSLMPAGLLDPLSDREVADLYAYLKSLK